MTKGLAVEAGKLDALLDKERHDDFSQLGLALNAYLAEAKYVLTYHGLLFGNYFSRADKQIIFSNASRRLLRVKEVLLTNPGLIKSEPPNLDFTVDKFFETVGTSAHLNKDRDMEDILKNWTSSGGEGEHLYHQGRARSAPDAAGRSHATGRGNPAAGLGGKSAKGKGCQPAPRKFPDWSTSSK